MGHYVSLVAISARSEKNIRYQDFAQGKIYFCVCIDKCCLHNFHYFSFLDTFFHNLSGFNLETFVFCQLILLENTDGILNVS